MKKKLIKLTESDLHNIIKECVNKTYSTLNEAESEGWVVDSSEAQEAYELAVREMGEETINNAIIRCLSDDTLAQCLAYIFRMYDFREWKNREEI